MTFKPTVTTQAETDLYKPKPLTKRQRTFMELWLGNPANPTYGNAYQSALKAGFSKSTANIITSNARGLKWVQDGKLLYSSLEPEHIYLGIQKIALTSQYDRDKLKALELMAKIRGMTIDRSESSVTVKFVNSVPRPIVDIGPEDTTESAQ